MAPKPPCIQSGQAYCLAKEGERYLIYFPNLNVVSFNLQTETGRYRAVWFDPATGATADGGVVWGNQTYQFASPFGYDAVLDLKFLDNPSIDIELLEFRAEQREQGRFIMWRCLIDGQTAGFFVERSESPQRFFHAVAPFIPVDEAVRPGEERQYSCVDSAAVRADELVYRLIRVTLDGSRQPITECSVTNRLEYQKPFLRIEAAPNPAKGGLSFSAVLPQDFQGEAAIYDLKGRLVHLLHGGSFSSGIWRRHWDGKDQFGRRVPAGVYCLVLKGGDRTHHLKFTLLP
ncbi:MAG: hypothetical protein ONB12_03775 [candidate division KSB1 bacterium]|nr:hypothetical protein [candidate division KSB1 bacterium]